MPTVFFITLQTQTAIAHGHGFACRLNNNSLPKWIENCCQFGSRSIPAHWVHNASRVGSANSSHGFQALGSLLPAQSPRASGTGQSVAGTVPAGFRHGAVCCRHSPRGLQARGSLLPAQSPRASGTGQSVAGTVPAGFSHGAVCCQHSPRGVSKLPRST